MIDSDKPITEAEVLGRWKFISTAMLRKAREDGQIAWIPGKWHSRLYRPGAVEAFIASLENPAHASGSSKSYGSLDSGLSPELEEYVARTLAREISKVPKKSPRNHAGGRRPRWLD